MKQVTVPEEQARTGVLWVCLNSVDFSGNEEAVREHRRMLLECRRKMAKIEGVEPKEVESEMLDTYDAVKAAWKLINRKKGAAA